MEEFPHLVEMQKKYKKDGLASVSVSVDDPSDPQTKEKVLKFLRKQNADFPNLILDEKPEVWQKKFGIEGPPCVFVFDRTGKIAKKFSTGERYDTISKFVAELLQKP
jgi:peroxiredoxin